MTDIHIDCYLQSGDFLKVARFLIWRASDKRVPDQRKKAPIKLPPLKVTAGSRSLYISANDKPEELARRLQALFPGCSGCNVMVPFAGGLSGD